RPAADPPQSLITARQVLEMATRGGAAVLGRSDIGSLAVGKCADLIAIRLDRLEFAGGLHDPVAACVLCAPVHVDFSFVHGRPVVEHGRLTLLDLDPVIEAHNRAALRLVAGE
ncbi:MAG: amidohydrolase family protein, partial [Anaerolineales bacterium]|nr:amidohydrolase family protein [Anaerolineales bacterium]